ncbi:MAG: MFS transporter [Syntrophales bacterium]|nr:MFS transporter [Syntrophales bacterium]
MAVLGFSSGLPLSLTGSTLSAWLVSKNVDVKTIGIFALVGLPYAFKFFWSPFLDRFALPFLGRRRGWMFTTQVGLMVFIASMGLWDPSHELRMIAFFALAISFLSASQDIVLDAYRTEILEKEERGAGAGIWILGYRTAILVSGAFALVLSDFVNWTAVFFILGLFMMVGILATIASSEPVFLNDGSRECVSAPLTVKEAVIMPFIDFLRRPGAFEVLLFLVIYKIGDVAAAQMTTPFILHHIGFSRAEMGVIFKGLGMGATIAGSITGGALMTRWSLKKSLFIFGVLQGVSTLGFLILEVTGRNVWALGLVIALENISGGMGTTAYIALLMSLCNVRYTATQYALLSSVMSLGRYLTGAPTGYIVDYMGWVAFFVVCTLASVPALILLSRYERWNVNVSRNV